MSHNVSVSKTARELSDAFGYMTASEVMALTYLASQCKTIKPLFVNVGAGNGTSSLAMAEGKPTARIVSVDISEGGPLGGLENELTAFDNAGRPSPEQICMPSHEAGALWDQGEIDLLFIDDGHMESDVRGDIDVWLPHLRHKGIIIFHDYGSNDWPDVKRVVDEVMADHTLLLIADTMIAFRCFKDAL